MRKKNISKLTRKGSGSHLGLNLGKIGHINLLGVGSLLSLVVLGLVLISPATSTDTHAESNWSSTVTQFNARIQPSISISAPDSVNLDIVQGMGDDTFYQASGKLVVATNNASGYRILVSSASNTSSLVSVDNASDAVISSIPTARQAGEFGDNTWGYYITSSTNSLDETVYYPMSVTTTEALKVNTASSTTTYDLGFGTRLDTSLPAGTYSNSILISAVANPLEIHSLLDLTFMQDMTSSICAETPSAYNESTGKSDTSSPYYLEPVTKQLYDIRDGNMYWVARLADGNCWMTQNLALNLSTERTLTPGDTDVTTPWTPDNSTETALKEPTNNRPTHSWNFGLYVSAVPDVTSTCFGEDGSNISMVVGQELSRCPNVQNVAGWSPTFTAQNGDWKNIKNRLVAVNETSQTYDSHYLIGNYYQFKAVTAETGSIESTNTTAGETFTVQDTTGSICPKGWTLPVSGKNIAEDAEWPLDRMGSFYRLLLAYGYPETGSSTTDANSTTQWIINGSHVYGKFTGENKILIGQYPLTMHRTGSIRPQTNGLHQLGEAGNLWSSTIYSADNAYHLGFSGAGVYPSYYSSYGFGQTVRCIAR